MEQSLTKRFALVSLNCLSRLLKNEFGMGMGGGVCDDMTFTAPFNYQLERDLQLETRKNLDPRL